MIHSKQRTTWLLLLCRLFPATVQPAILPMIQPYGSTQIQSSQTFLGSFRHHSSFRTNQWSNARLIGHPCVEELFCSAGTLQCQLVLIVQNDWVLQIPRCTALWQSMDVLCDVLWDFPLICSLFTPCCGISCWYLRQRQWRARLMRANGLPASSWVIVRKRRKYREQKIFASGFCNTYYCWFWL
jgi:hypothetical protein